VEPIEIKDGDLLLRGWRPADAAAVHRACQDADIQRWTNVPVPYRLSDAEWFVGNAPAAWASDRQAPLGIFDLHTGELLGSNGLVLIDRAAGVGELGYWTAPWARGRGVAERSSRAVARWALGNGPGQLGLARLVWRADPGNHASRLVALRAGFRMEGLLRDDLPARGGGRSESRIGSLLPGEVPENTPVPFLADGAVARQARLFGGPQPTLDAVTPAGERIVLRPLATADLHAVVAACRDPESIRWTTVPHPYEESDARFFVHAHAPRTWRLGDGAIFAVADPSGAYAGSMDLRLSPLDPGVGDVGYLIAPWARGRGYASAALRAVARWGVQALGLRRIEWCAYIGNDASRRVAEKAGFTIEGIHRAACLQRGERRDAWVGAVLADDLRAGDDLRAADQPWAGDDLRAVHNPRAADQPRAGDDLRTADQPRAGDDLRTADHIRAT
jgi:RimJ/RimL family protein N-acetyltransferase